MEEMAPVRKPLPSGLQGKSTQTESMTDWRLARTVACEAEPEAELLNLHFPPQARDEPVGNNTDAKLPQCWHNLCLHMGARLTGSLGTVLPDISATGRWWQA